MREQFKDVRIAPNGTVLKPNEHVDGEREFRIERVTASDGNWIVLQLTGGKASDRDIFDKIQTYLFNRISVFKEKAGARLPLRIHDEGRWLVPDLALEYDLDTVNTLYGEALGFNFDDFFERQRLLMAAEKEAAKALISNPPASQKG